MLESKKMEACENCKEYDFLALYRGQNLCGNCTKDILDKEGRLTNTALFSFDEVYETEEEEEEDDNYYRDKYLRDTIIDEIEDALRDTEMEKLKAIHTLLVDYN